MNTAAAFRQIFPGFGAPLRTLLGIFQGPRKGAYRPTLTTAYRSIYAIMVLSHFIIMYYSLFHFAIMASANYYYGYYGWGLILRIGL
jgi:hypothetical protein